jgi:hypothetical protein
MQVTLEIPDELIAQLIAAGKAPSLVSLELLSVESYRTGRLSEGQLKQILGYSTRLKVHALLADHGVTLHYTPEDLDVDDETSRFLRILQTPELTPHS